MKDCRKGTDMETYIKLVTPSGVVSDIYCGEGTFEKYVKEKLIGHENFLLTDSNVYRIYGELIEKTFSDMPFFVLEAGEQSKNFDGLKAILDKMIEAGLHRNSYLFALGGGVIGDIGGLAASLYMRGIHCVQIPTTLLSQVDSSVGGKTAVDVGKVKNVVGAFYQPETVIADPLFFKTLPLREIRCGLGEIVKHGGLNGLLFDRLYENKEKLFDLSFIASVVPDNIRHKANVVEIDEKEKGLRKSLNMGHTTGHAIELFYGDRSHGECVLVGLYIETLFAESKGLCDRAYTAKLKELIREVLGEIPPLKDAAKAAYLAKMDKKNTSSDRITMTVPCRRNEYRELTVPYEEYEAFLRKCGEEK